MSQVATMHPGTEPYGAMRFGSADWPNPYQRLGINLTAFMTFLLICSSVTMVKGLEGVKNGQRRIAQIYLLLTIIGGAGFLGLQAFEWTKLINEGLKIFGNPWGASLFGTTFFIITGFHGLHVTGGVIYLSVMLALVSKRTTALGTGWTYNVVEIAGLYWHFVDLVWIMVFTFIYLV